MKHRAFELFIEGKGNVKFGFGDFVECQSYEDELPFIARIAGIAFKRGKVKVDLQWMYRPGDLPKNFITSLSAPNELFFCNSSDENDSSVICGGVRVGFLLPGQAFTSHLYPEKRIQGESFAKVPPSATPHFVCAREYLPVEKLILPLTQEMFDRIKCDSDMPEKEQS